MTVSVCITLWVAPIAQSVKPWTCDGKVAGSKWHSLTKNRCYHNKNNYLFLVDLNKSKYISFIKNIAVHCCKYYILDSKMKTNKSLIF